MRDTLSSLVASVNYIALLCVCGFWPTVKMSAASIAADFSLPYRAADTSEEPFHLYDLEGKVILVEFFYYWCPHCQAATPRIESDIVQFYRNGNADGLSVQTVFVNLESRSGFHQDSTDDFVRAQQLDPVLDDFDLSVALGFGATGTPHLAVINGVADSSSHEPWEIIFNASGYDPEKTISLLQAAIDSVRAADVPPLLRIPQPRPGEPVEIEISGQKGRTYRIEVSSNLKRWDVLAEVTMEAEAASFQDTDVDFSETRFYRVRIP